jgi:N-methylhydantoinase B
LPDTPIVCFVGILDARKNVDAILRVWRATIRSGAVGHLVLVGPEPVDAAGKLSAFGEQLRRFVVEEGLGDTVTFAGRQADVAPYLQSADIFFFPSRREGMPNVLLEAMAHFHPSRAIANAGSSSALGIFWTKGRPGQSTMQYEILGSAYGGGEKHDGASGTACHLSNLHVTPIEILESEYPCRIHQFGRVPDSGGAGRWRGGLSMIREYELLEDATIVRRFDKSKHPPKGLDGGADGQGAKFVIRPGTPEEYVSPSSGKWDLKKGDRFILQTAAGGGYGHAAQRDPLAVVHDIAEGYVTREAADKIYDTKPEIG